jgi:ATP adenylyltransferase
MPADDPRMGPDALYAPWRLDYVENVDAGKAHVPTSPTASAPATPTGSFILDYWLNPAADHANHVILRDERGMILLNKFPYAGGHLLVALGDPRPRLMDYDDAQRAHLWRLVDRASQILDRALAPQGINIGVNQGRAAGAGIPQHLHVHLVPRWSGDVNFLAVVGHVRMIPCALDAMADRLRRAV